MEITSLARLTQKYGVLTPSPIAAEGSGVYPDDSGYRALLAILSWSWTHSSGFYGRAPAGSNPDPDPRVGWYGIWPADAEGYLGLYWTALTQLLTERGFDPKATVLDWYHRGWLLTTARRHHILRVARHGVRVQVIAIAPDVVASEGRNTPQIAQRCYQIQREIQKEERNVKAH